MEKMEISNIKLREIAEGFKNSNQLILRQGDKQDYTNCPIQSLEPLQIEKDGRRTV